MFQHYGCHERDEEGGLLFYNPIASLFLQSTPEAASFLFERGVPKVSKPPSWPRSWASSSPFKLCSSVDAWASLHLLGQPNTFLAAGECQIDIVYL